MTKNIFIRQILNGESHIAENVQNLFIRIPTYLILRKRTN